MENFDAYLNDYLITQGISLPPQKVKETTQILMTIMRMADINIDSSTIWNSNHKPHIDAIENFFLHTYIEKTPQCDLLIRQIYAICDTAFGQFPQTSHLSLYMLFPNGDNTENQLIRLIYLGHEKEAILKLKTELSTEHLALRSAQSAWFSHVQDTIDWLNTGDLTGERHQAIAEEWALPICHPEGTVLGVLYGESLEKNSFNKEMQIWWVALSLILYEPILKLQQSKNE